MYPSKLQKEELNKWFGASRFVYNRILHYLKNTDKPSYSKKFLRSQFINDSVYQNENEWMLQIPYDVRDEALSDILHNYKSNFKKSKKQSTKKPFDIGFRSKKLHNSMNILSKHWKHKRGVYSKVYSNWKYESNIHNPIDLNYTSRLVKTPHLNELFLCVPRPLHKSNSCENQTTSPIISLDPGVRTFLTGFDTNDQTIEIAKNDIARLARLSHYRNKLQKVKKITVKKALTRISKKINNLVNDLHKKVIKWLCMNHSMILIPKLNFHEFKQMRKKQRHRMSLLNHCKFVDKLLEKQNEYPKCNVMVVKEAYTSKTCSNCGFIKYNLHSNKTFKCDDCGIIIDRDINGARNILLKKLSPLGDVVA